VCLSIQVLIQATNRNCLFVFSLKFDTSDINLLIFACCMLSMMWSLKMLATNSAKLESDITINIHNFLTIIEYCIIRFAFISNQQNQMVFSLFKFLLITLSLFQPGFEKQIKNQQNLAFPKAGLQNSDSKKKQTLSIPILRLFIKY